MTYFKTTDLLTILPINETLRQSLKEKLTGNEAQKIDFEQLLWGTFIEYKDQLENIYYQQLLTEVELGKRELTADLMQTAKERVYQEFVDILSGKKQDLQQVEEIREKLQSLAN